MEAEHPHVAVGYRLWDAAARGDAEAVLGLYAPEAVLHFSGDNPMAGTYRGREAVVAFLARSGEVVDELHAELLDVYASEHGVVLRYRVKALAGAHRLDCEFLSSMQLRDGVVAGARLVATDPAHNDAFWRAALPEPLSPAI